MKTGKLFLILAAIVASQACGQTGFESYHDNGRFSLTAPGALKYGLRGYDNPANLAFIQRPDMMFAWSTSPVQGSDFNDWGIFAAVPHAGFGLIRQKSSGSSVADCRAALAWGSRSLGFGLGYGWSSGDRTEFQRKNILYSGLLCRPNRHLSIGLIGTKALAGPGQEGAAELAVRPWGNQWLTVFSDYAIRDGQNLKHGHWSAGGVIEALPGMRLSARYYDTKNLGVGLEVSFGHAGVGAQARFNDGKRHSNTRYMIRLGGTDRTLIDKVPTRQKRYLKLDLLGGISYQKYRMFDGSKTLSSILAQIETAKNDPAIAGIIVGASGMRTDREKMWEIREKLKDFQSAGKNVIIFIDRVGIAEYYFASVANRIVIDPIGSIELQGLAFGKTYLKGTLEKLGISFEEWRFFKYKSAFEQIARDRMSDADREQWQAFLDDNYSLLKSDICQGRRITPETFEQLVNDSVSFMAKEAKNLGLVDTLGRWNQAEEIVKKITGCSIKVVTPQSLARQQPPDDLWSENPKIAVIYALGVCAMDEGIKARSLVRDVERAANDKSVKAVVIRVDSPGGDALASDVVAEAVKRCRAKKPVIISQGAVAGSGGYWLSMYGDTIVSAPMTVTGSIGVIGGWIYNKGLKEKMGLSTDLVKIGKHADLGFGFSLPFLGFGIPDRNLSPEEYAKMERTIKTFYRDFVDKVSTGRRRSTEEIETVAQGRIWSGLGGKEIGLVDVLGGLEKAVEIAREKAKIPRSAKITLLELPIKGWFNPGLLKLKLFGTQFKADAMMEQMIFRIQYNGQPLAIMPLEDLMWLDLMNEQ